MIAMNHVYGVAKADGLTLGMPNYGVYLDQLAGRKEVRFDITKMLLHRLAGEERYRSLRARRRPVQDQSKT